MEKFDFNYQISDWEQRKELVEKYIADNKILEQIEELIIENTVPDLFDKKTGEPIRYHQLRDSRLTELNRLMIRLYDYILYAYDKEIDKQEKKNKLMTSTEYKIMCDGEQGIKSYLVPRKRKIYKEPKWAMINHDVIEHNQNKINRFNNDLGIVIDEQIQVYEKLKDNVTTMNKDILDKNKIRKMDMISNICYDINTCEECRNSLNRVYISESIRSNHDQLSDVDIQYNRKIIRTVLNNWTEVCNEANKHPTHTIHDIKMDFEKVLNEISLTSKQKYVLQNVLDGIVLDDSDKGHFNFIIEKILKKLK